MKPKSKLLSLLLTICLVVGLMPTAALAAGTDTGKAIQLVDSGTAANIGGGQADNIYFGTYQQSSDGSGGYNTDPIKWRVLENANGQLFLLSDQNLDVFQYHTDYESVTWEKSTMRSWLNGYGASENTGGSSGTDYTEDNFISTAFSAKEQPAIANTTVVNDNNPDWSTEGGNDTTDKIFLLSIAEAQNSSYFADNSSRIATNTAYVAGGGKTGSSYMNGVGEADYWWLRSPGYNDNDAAIVDDIGGVASHGSDVDIADYAVRPAFNLDLTSVLFTSAAAGGKIPAAGSGGNQGGEAADAIFEIPTTTTSEWKLTLLDSSRNSFSVSNQTWSGNRLTFSYSDARTGTNEYISAVIEENGEITYYGRILQLDGTTNGASGTASLSLPSNVTLDDTTTLYVFNEQYNGDKLTDYASPLQSISPASVPNPDPNPNPNPNPNYNQRPVIIIPTTDQNVSASVGNTVTMRITANYAQSYQWYVDTGSGFKAIPGATGAAYTTSQVALGNNGYRYYCVARNAYGTAVSPVFTLNVLEYMGIPATGDSAQAGLWIGLMMIALAGLAACAVLYRKRKQER